MKNAKNIFLTVGGTGGHIYPGLALAQELLERNPGIACSFVIDKKPIVESIFKKEGYKTYRVDASPFPRNKFWQICRFLYKTAKGLAVSMLLLKQKKPDLVIAFGAYISVPVVLSAYFLKIPVILHEQNYFPGMANRFLSFMAARIAISYEESRDYFPPGKTVVTGNPVRKELFDADRKEALDYFNLDDEKTTILIFGGSQGARSINQAVYSLIPYLESVSEEIQIIHVSGQRSDKQIIKEYKKYRLNALVYTYLERMEYAYKLADIVIARAGATTIAEISAQAIPTIFIPYPHASARHQYFNARPLCDKGLAICFPEKKLSGAGLAVRLIPLLTDARRRRSMAEGYKKYSQNFKGAAGRLAEVVEKELRILK
ncbi:MAG: undecaprenyldiphospho-muramoylpentapeptide beta-N-acetylglucosaminyltransferase [Elusimicrobiota bacterium]|nr:undecaprenyldiphospho-muramoylpentapeptide beta-N-acetylglucosaminyltransferase [Elusimicrobiota bacterium]